MMAVKAWMRTTIGEVCEVNPPRPRIADLPDGTPVLFVPMAAVDDVTGTITASETRPLGEMRTKSYRTFGSNDVLLAKITPCMENGKAAVVPKIPTGLGFGSTEFHVLRPRVGTNARFIWHFVRQERFRREARDHMTGSVGQLRVPPSFISNAELFLPNADGQDAIVGFLDEVIALKHSSTDRLAMAAATLDQYRRAVLAAASSGRLTADWREKRRDGLAAVSPSTAEEDVARPGRFWGGGSVPELSDDERESLPTRWTWLKVDQLGSSPGLTVQIGPMSMRSSEFTTQGVPVLNVGSVQDGHIDAAKRNFLPTDRAKDFARYSIQQGDVLFTRSGTVGRCAVVPAADDGSLITFHLLRVRTDPKVCLPSYLWCAFNGSASIKRQRDEAQIGSTRAGFNTALLAGLDVPVPPVQEQVEIVRRVDRLLTFGQALAKQIDVAAQQVQSASQSVVSNAFRRGEPQTMPARAIESPYAG